MVRKGSDGLVPLGQRRCAGSSLRLRKDLRREVTGDLELGAHRIEGLAQLAMLDRPGRPAPACP